MLLYLVCSSRRGFAMPTALVVSAILFVLFFLALQQQQTLTQKTHSDLLDARLVAIQMTIERILNNENLCKDAIGNSDYTNPNLEIRLRPYTTTLKAGEPNGGDLTELLRGLTVTSIGITATALGPNAYQGILTIKMQKTGSFFGSGKKTIKTNFLFKTFPAGNLIDTCTTTKLAAAVCNPTTSYLSGFDNAGAAICRPLTDLNMNLSCAQGYYLTGYNFPANQPVCTPLKFNGFSCSPPKRVIGFQANGTAICK
jgi:hypothetical protein